MTYVHMYIGMLDPIIISYKLAIHVSVTYYRILQHPVNTTYHKNHKCHISKVDLLFSLTVRFEFQK